LNSQPPICFYYRNGCHLCEEMAAALHAGWPQYMEHMQWLDVDSSEAWRAEYGHRVPVLTIAGQVICEFRLDAEAVSACIGSSRISL